MSNEQHSADASPGETMIRMICGAWVSRTIHVVVTLGIPDLLASGAKSSHELAVATGTNADFLHRTMRALAVEGLFSMDEDERFTLTSVGATLRRDALGSLHAWAMLMLGEVHQNAWSELLGSVRTGRSAFERRYGCDLWTFCRDHPEHAALFSAAMTAFTESYVAAVLAAYPFTGLRRIVDVGGGDGHLLAAILGAEPAASGIVFELPTVAANARKRLGEANFAGRFAVVAGDALVDVPPEADACILSRVLHDWDDDHSVRLLENCGSALAPGGRVVVIERIVPVGRSGMAAQRRPVLSDIVLTDLNMMVMTSGRERTLDAYRRLSERAGLHLARVVPTGSAISVIELRRAD